MGESSERVTQVNVISNQTEATKDEATGTSPRLLPHHGSTLAAWPGWGPVVVVEL